MTPCEPPLWELEPADLSLLKQQPVPKIYHNQMDKRLLTLMSVFMLPKEWTVPVWDARRAFLHLQDIFSSTRIRTPHIFLPPRHVLPIFSLTPPAPFCYTPSPSPSNWWLLPSNSVRHSVTHWGGFRVFFWGGGVYVTDVLLLCDVLTITPQVKSLISESLVPHLCFCNGLQWKTEFIMNTFTFINP